MPAAFVSLAFFFGWWAIGLASLAALRLDTSNLRLALAAPALGTAVTVIPLFALSNAGMPMRAGGPPTIFAALVASLSVLALRRPRLPLGVVPIVLVCLADLVLVARPMFHFSFHWLANANSDMGYYVLSATSLLNHGLLTPVDVTALAHNRDFSTTVYDLHALGIRPGTDITLSALAATTGHSPTDIYMPMILAVSLCGVCAAGSLAMQFARVWWAAALASALLAVSPLAAYGVLQQLLPQVWGLALAAALLALLMTPEIHRKPRTRVNETLAISILVVALFTVYIELAASLLVGYALYVAVLVGRRRVSISSMVPLWIAPTVATLLVVNTYVPRELHYVTAGIRNGTRATGGVGSFGYALVPTALPAIVGLRSLFSPPTGTTVGPWTLATLAALALLVVAFVAALVGTIRGSAASAVIVSYFALGALLAYKKSDFGLFKLYMYCQPFLAAAVASWCSSLSKRFGMVGTEFLSRKFAVVGAGLLLAALVAAEARTQSGYVNDSRSPIDLRNASEADLLPAFTSFTQATHKPVVPITDVVTLATLEAATAGHKPLYFVSRDVFSLDWKSRRFHVPSASTFEPVVFGENRAATKVLASGWCRIIVPTGTQIVLNRRTLPEGSRDLVALDCAKARNLLVFIASSVGQPATLPASRTRVSFFQLVRDPSFPNRTFSAAGRYALFRIIKPARTIRLELEYSTSSLQNSSRPSRLPHASVSGANLVRFPVVGEGSARVFSPPLRPQIIGGAPYVLLDLGKPGQLPVERRGGITGVSGGSVSLDPRLLTSYVRNVSLIDDSQYRRLHPPESLAKFPTDLGAKDLEYSGISEDGWIGKDAYAVLSSGDAESLVINAQVLPLGQQKLEVRVDGNRVVNTPVPPGPLKLVLHVPRSASPRKVELRWGRERRLSRADPRYASALLSWLGFLSAPLTLDSFPHDLHNSGFDYSGIYGDGRLKKSSYAILGAGARTTLVLRAQVERSPGSRTQHLRIAVDGRVVKSLDVAPGLLEVRAPVPASTSGRKIELFWAHAGLLSAKNPRQASARLLFLGYVPPRS